MIMLLHVISAPFTQDHLILFVPIKSKGDGFSFLGIGHFNVGEPAVGVS